jgi:hypothetical protein
MNPQTQKARFDDKDDSKVEGVGYPTDPLRKIEISTPKAHTSPDFSQFRQGAGSGRKAKVWHAIRSFCLECTGSAKGVHECEGHTLSDGTACHLYPYRLGQGTKRRGPDGKMLSVYRASAMRKAIRENCRHCLGSHDLTLCTSPNCHLFSSRLAGKKAAQAGSGSIK